MSYPTIPSLTDPNLDDRCAVVMSDERDLDDRDNGDRGVGVLEAKPKTKTKKPSLYKVLMLNDDYTPMEFVVHVLVNFFGKTEEQATQIMLHVHQKGVGVCGVYTLEVAEAKVTHTIDFARQNNHPLQCEIEKDD